MVVSDDAMTSCTLPREVDKSGGGPRIGGAFDDGAWSNFTSDVRSGDSDLDCVIDSIISYSPFTGGPVPGCYVTIEWAHPYGPLTSW